MKIQIKSLKVETYTKDNCLYVKAIFKNKSTAKRNLIFINNELRTKKQFEKDMEEIKKYMLK